MALVCFYTYYYCNSFPPLIMFMWRGTYSTWTSNAKLESFPKYYSDVWFWPAPFHALENDVGHLIHGRDCCSRPSSTKKVAVSQIPLLARSAKHEQPQFNFAHGTNT